MGERKVLNKYIPPDFDPRKIPRRFNKQQQHPPCGIRNMLPMSVRCNPCGNYMYKGTKFNTRKETVIGETYLGLKLFRFYFRCTNCKAEFAIKTDPCNSDYVLEFGATRNFEPWRGQKILDVDVDTTSTSSRMRSLQKRSMESKREMDDVEALDEIKSINSSHETVNLNSLLTTLNKEEDHDEMMMRKKKKLKLTLEEEADEALIKSLFHHHQHQPHNYVRRISDDEDDFKLEGFSSEETGKVDFAGKSCSRIKPHMFKSPVASHIRVKPKPRLNL